MNKFSILFLTLLLALRVAMKAESAKEKRDNSIELFSKLFPYHYILFNGISNITAKIIHNIPQFALSF